MGNDSPPIVGRSRGGANVNPVIEGLLAAGEFSHRGKRYPIAHSTSADICRRYADLIVDKNLKRGLEIGTLFGFSTLFLADAFAQTGGHVDTIDIRYAKRTWANGQQIENIHEVAERLVAEAGHSERVTFRTGDSNAAVIGLIEAGHKYDFALIDGSHKFEAVLIDFIGVDRLLRLGGYVAMDDIGSKVSAKAELAGGPNRVLGLIMASGRYKIDLWSANVAVCEKLADPQK